MDYRIIAVDFDGTLCYSNWPELGEPNRPLIEYLRSQKDQGNKLILWTCRAGEALDKAVSWCREHELEFDAVNDNLPEIIEIDKLFGYSNDRERRLASYIEKADGLFKPGTKPDRKTLKRHDLSPYIFIYKNTFRNHSRKVNFIISTGLCKILLTYHKLHLDI